MEITIIILLIVTHSNKFHLRLSHVWLSSSWLFDKYTIWVPFHILYSIRGIAGVFEIKYVLIILELNKPLSRCTLAQVLSLVTWLILSSRWADAVYLPYFLTHFVIIKVTSTLNFLVRVEELLVSAHNGRGVFESYQFLCVWIYALCAVDALFVSRA